MVHFLSAKPASWLALLAGGLLAATLPAKVLAQTPVWNTATVGSPDQASSTSQMLATVVDASGNVLVAGTFTGQLTLGSTVLTSAGDQDFFVAKWLPASNDWAWAQRGGGTGTDQALGLAVSGTSIYVTGYLTNTAGNAAGVTLGSTTVAGASTSTGTTATQDLFVAKYSDASTNATLSWAQVGGGSGADQGQAVAVRTSGSSTTVYVTGSITNDSKNTNQVVFGSAVAQSGASATASLDLVVAKYTDAGSSATLGWTQVGGGTQADAGQGIAVNGTNVYVTGYLTNNKSDDNTVLFGGAGTTAGTKRQLGAGTTGALSSDLVLAKYTDGGTSGTFGWTHVGGGTANDQSLAVAVSDASVYVTGFINNNNNTANSASGTNKVVFGGTGTTQGTAVQLGTGSVSNDLVLAKYTDGGTSGTFNWSQVGGGGGADAGQAIAVSSTGIYVTGYITNNNVNTNSVLFGGSGSMAGTVTQNGASSVSSSDIVVAKYTDGGSSATLSWTQVGGGTGADQGQGLALNNDLLYIVGNIVPAATFSSLTVANPAGSDVSFLGRLGAAPLPVKLVRFTAGRVPNTQTVRLAWATASEVGSSYFAVERSSDGIAYTTLGQLAAAGSSAATQAYTWLDSALPTDVSVVYYRLRQVDQDGAVAYSPVCSVTGAGHTLALYPNPAQGATTLTGVLPGETVRIVDALGRVVGTSTADSTGSASLLLGPHLASGLYVIRTASQTARLTVVR